VAGGDPVSELAEGLERYLALRRSLGYKLERPGQVLADFVAGLDEAGISHITTEIALSWAINTTNPDSSWRAQRLGFVRGFARYLHSADPRHDVPPAGLVARRRGRVLPYLFSSADIQALMDAAARLRSPFQAQTMQTLIGLLAVTGLRVGEAIRLSRTDIDFAAGIITVRDSKGNKSRHVPISPSTSNALLSYLTDWGCYFPNAKAALTTTTGTRLRSSNLGTSFDEVVSLAGLKGGPQGALPRLRGLRHSFAVAALVDFYESDCDVAAMLPVLSAYMGHVSPASTYWYLSASPELLAAAARRASSDLGSPQ
jgi:integrase/recombinase XerD